MCAFCINDDDGPISLMVLKRVFAQCVRVVEHMLRDTRASLTHARVL